MYTIVESTSAHIWDNSEVVNNQEEQEAEEGRRNFVMIEQYLTGLARSIWATDERFEY